ncbi:hypothetical protein [Burkholderia cenocepacia]|uniref:hypothetical protein n=1 Tax=Burkholderia cenocepacia TaxID=95486 RepID=UPI00286EF6FA|nr:hypothetical protein [Burkholderia cenocepacia]
MNRDTTNTNGTVAKLPDMQNLLAGVEAWKEGGANRALMQGAGAALVTGLAGGNAVGGAAGAAIASIASGKLNELSSAIAGSDPTGNANMNQALGNIVANALATGAGAAVGGSQGRSLGTTLTGSTGSFTLTKDSGRRTSRSSMKKRPASR